MRKGNVAQVKGWRNVSIKPTEEELIEQQRAEEMLRPNQEKIRKHNEEIF